MIPLTQQDREKLELLDTILSSISVERLKELAEEEAVVAALKGDKQQGYILRQLVDEHNTMYTDLMNTRLEMQTLKNDMIAVIKAISNLYNPPYNQELQSIKSKYGVY
jgi:hypothetical protein